MFDLGRLVLFRILSAHAHVVLAALYWKRANKYGAAASVIAVVATWIYLLCSSLTRRPGTSGANTHCSETESCRSCTFCILAGGVIAMVVFSLITPKPSEETIRKFFPDTL